MANSPSNKPTGLAKYGDLKGRLIFLLLALIVYRIGAHVPVPGIDPDMLRQLFDEQKGGILGLFNMFSGGALSRFSVFALGIMPYITAQIILQLMQAVIPSLGELAKEGESGQRKITQYTRYLTIGLALISSVGYLFLFKSYGVSFSNMGIAEGLENFIVVFTMLVGAIVIMWLGEVITRAGSATVCRLSSSRTS